MKITKSALPLFALLSLATSLFAQNAKNDGKLVSHSAMSNYVVSAKAGVVNIVEGDASVFRAQPFAVPEMLISGDELKPGDTVKTGAHGRVEILLNPGCYLRLGDASQFGFFFDDSSSRIKLVRGSVLIEASAIDDTMVVDTPNTKFEIDRIGLYRINVADGSKSEIVVCKGLALVGGVRIKEGREAIVESGAPVIAKMDKRDVDALDDWSKTRAKALIATNSSLSRRGIKSTYGIASINNNAWIYDPFSRCYTFLPFTGGFSSPYGWGYDIVNPYWYRWGWPGYYGGNQSGGNGGSNTQGGGSGAGSGSGGGNNGGGNTGHHHNPPPPPPVFTDPGRSPNGGMPSIDREASAPKQRHP